MARVAAVSSSKPAMAKLQMGGGTETCWLLVRKLLEGGVVI